MNDVNSSIFKKKVYHDLDLLSSFYIQLFTFVYVIAGFYAISNVRYRTMNLMLYPAYIGVTYHECMYFVCETLYIKVYIQTVNKRIFIKKQHIPMF